MTTFTHFMSDDHRRCDELFAATENAVQDADWGLAEAQHRQFLDAMQHHFAMEEEVLFPAFEETSGNPMGPTTVMRHEHIQMRALFEEMTQSLAGQQTEDYLGATETLLILMQQHNAKEEQILYPMSDELLEASREALLQKMQAQAGQ